MTLKTRLESLASAIGADVKSLTTSLGTKEATTNKGAASGYAPLGSDVRVPDANLPSRLQTFGGSAISNANLALDTGFYTCSNLTSNTPVAGNYYHLLVIPYNYAGYTSQIALDVLSDAMWRRWSNGVGTWAPWKRIGIAGKSSMPVLASSSTMGIPGAQLQWVEQLQQAAGFNYYLPFTVEEPVSITEGRLEVTTAGAAGAKAACSIHTADSTNIVPVTKVVEFGEIDVTTTGTKSATIAPVILLPGRYVMAQRCTSGGAWTARMINYSTPRIGQMAAFWGSGPFRSQFYKAMAYAYPAPAAPTAPDSANYSPNAIFKSFWALVYTYPSTN